MAGKYMTGKKRNPWPIILTAVLLIVLSAGGLLARYRSQMERRAEMIAADFHISSDYLEEESENASYSISHGAGGFQIKLYNFEKENVAQITKTGITYQVTVKNGTCDKTGGTFPADTAATHTLTVTPDGSNKPVEVTVTTEPYAKPLTATFDLIGTAKPEKSLAKVKNDGDNYVLTVRTGQYAGKVTLTWPAGLMPDNTNTQMRTWTGTSGTFDAQAFTTYELIFFNPEGKTFTANDFQMTTPTK